MSAQSAGLSNIQSPFINAQTGRCAMCLQVSRIDHHRLLLAVPGCHPGQHLREDAFVAPALPTVVKRFVRTILFRRIPPAQSIAVYEDYSAQDAPLINTGFAVGLREVGLQTRHLRVAQPKEIRHVNARFSTDESCRSAEINGS